MTSVVKKLCRDSKSITCTIWLLAQHAKFGQISYEVAMRRLKMNKVGVSSQIKKFGIIALLNLPFYWQSVFHVVVLAIAVNPQVYNQSKSALPSSDVLDR